MALLLLGAGISLACLALPARAQPSVLGARQAFAEAQGAFLRGEYALVVELLEPFVGSETPADDIDTLIVRDSRKYLGAAYALLHERDAALSQFDWLLREIATNRTTGRLVAAQIERFNLNRARFIEEVQEVFAEVRARLLTLAAQQATDAQRSVTERREACVAGFESLSELAGTATIEVENDELPSWIPFGVGQFSNGNEELGYFFAISEALFAAAAFGSMVTVAEIPDGMPMFRTLGETLRVANVGLAVGFAVLLIVGIIESRIAFQPTRTETQEREIPEELRDPVHFCGSLEAGIALCF